MGPQVLSRRRAPPLQAPQQGPGEEEEESESELPEEWTGVSKSQIIKIIETLPGLGVPFELPRQYNKMSREQLIDIARERYKKEMDEVIRGSRARPGGRVRIQPNIIKDAFSSIAKQMSSYRRGGRVSGVF